MNNRFDALAAVEERIAELARHIGALEQAQAANGALDALGMHKLQGLQEAMQIFQARRQQLQEAASTPAPKPGKIHQG